MRLLACCGNGETPLNPTDSQLSPAGNPYMLARKTACGPLSLAFVDRYFGGNHSYGDFAKICPAGPAGTSLGQLKASAEKLGYNARALELTTKQLKRISNPTIVHLRPGDGIEHFAVFLGWDNRHQEFRIANPPDEIFSMSEGYLQKQFTGAALELSASPLVPLEELYATNSSSSIDMFLALFAVLGIGMIGLVSFWRFGGRNRVASGAAKAGLFVLIGCVCTGGCSDSQISQADQEDHYKVGLGVLKPNMRVKTSFSVANRTALPFEISSVLKSCECHTINAAIGKSIPPGSSTVIEVELPTGNAPGSFEEKFVCVTESDGKRGPSILLTVNGYVSIPIRATPSKLVFSGLNDKSPITKTVMIRTEKRDAVEHFTHAESSLPTVKTALISKQPAWMLFEVTGQGQSDASHGKITFHFEDGYKSVTIPVIVP